MKKNYGGYTLIEIMLGILIVSMVMIAGFQSLSAIGIAKIKLIEQTTIEKEAYFASEKFFEMIKKGGTIDYEEYWNRYSQSTTYGSGHFVSQSGFGNFGFGGTIGSTTYGGLLYYCRSGINLTNQMTGSGCLNNGGGMRNSVVATRINTPQRYGQYEQQFIDYNSDYDDNPGFSVGDEDSDGNIIGDDDDLFLGIGPQAFPDNTDVGELYLINSSGNERTFFRWKVGIDPNAPVGATCTGAKNMTGSGCLGTLQFLKLTGKDWGNDHSSGSIDVSQGDGIIDTWIIHSDFAASSNIVADSNTLMDSYWQSIFPNTIHVSAVEFYLYPYKKLGYSWRDTDPKIQVAPYIQLKLILQPSWKEKRKIIGVSPTVTIATTIQLSDLDLQ